jgi:hypothetical protein
MLIPYLGTRDNEYPVKLAERIESLMRSPHVLKDHEVSTVIARRRFDYDVLSAKIRHILLQLAPGGTSEGGILVPPDPALPDPPGKS